MQTLALAQSTAVPTYSLTQLLAWAQPSIINVFFVCVFFFCLFELPLCVYVSRSTSVYRWAAWGLCSVQPTLPPSDWSFSTTAERRIRCRWISTPLHIHVKPTLTTCSSRFPFLPRILCSALHHYSICLVGDDHTGHNIASLLTWSWYLLLFASCPTSTCPPWRQCCSRPTW